LGVLLRDAAIGGAYAVYERGPTGFRLRGPYCNAVIDGRIHVACRRRRYRADAALRESERARATCLRFSRFLSDIRHCAFSAARLVSAAGVDIDAADPSVAALCQLGRSFSVMAESRQLVTSGPYRFLRHPLYLTEEIAIIGLFMQFVSLWTALFLAVHVAIQLRRIHNEETVLSAKFPEYAAYKRNTSRLIPGIY